jgi:hypothetical protein
MKDIEFIIDDWIAGDGPDDRCAGTSAEFVMRIKDIHATKLFDTWSRTVTDRARLPLYPLAEWFAYNWWRLHYEAPSSVGSGIPIRWRLAHEVSAVGGGFIWPRLRFVSDDAAILVSAEAANNAPWEPVRYLNGFPATSISTADFDEAVEHLIVSVISRLGTLGVSAEPLMTIWNDVCSERDEPEFSEWRVLEARLGYDPDEAPDHLVSQGGELARISGEKSAWEIIPLLGNEELSLGDLQALAGSSGLDVSPEKLIDRQEAFQNPWEEGRALAHEVRRVIGRETGPLGDRDLLNALGAPAKTFDFAKPIGGPLSLAVRKSGQAVNTTLHFRKRNRPGIRFEAARFISEIITAEQDDVWLPQTDRSTARQRMQRAFAAEILAPIDEISESMDGDFTPDRFEEVADEYGVSVLAIRSHLANHGFLDPHDVAVGL